MTTKSFNVLKNHLKEVFYAGIKSVSSQNLIHSKIKFHDNILFVNNQSFPVGENIFLVGFGKAVMGMTTALEQILGDRLKKGIVSVPRGSKELIWSSNNIVKYDFPRFSSNGVKYCEGAKDNQPDDESLETTHEILDLVESLTTNDTLIVLISGGGSALLYMPRPTIDPDDKLELCKSLQNSGADITELNTVRQKLSLVKGGGLARMAYPAKVISLILSDIIGDPIHLIASGPTVYSPKSPDPVITILKKYNLFTNLEGDLKSLILSKEIPPNVESLDSKKQFKHVNNILIGNNLNAIEAAKDEVYKKGMIPLVLRNDVKGLVQDISLAYAQIVRLICSVLDKNLGKEKFIEEFQLVQTLSLSKNELSTIYDRIETSGQGLVLIGAGEPTVVVKGQGKGGRNQELALHFSMDWLVQVKCNPSFTKYEVLMLSGGTDGQDGPTDAAGAFGYPALGPTIYNVYTKLKNRLSKQILKIPNREPFEEINNVEELNNIIASKAGIEELNNIQLLEILIMEIERMLPENTIRENDSYNFYSRFKNGNDLIKTGFTGTNVMDLHFIYVNKKHCECYSTLEPITEGFFKEHDLRIDQSTIEKYNAKNARVTFDIDESNKTDKIEDDKFNVSIVDTNLSNLCSHEKSKL